MAHFQIACDDYIGARCCILNSLFCGFPLLCQAIEKLLKATIFLESGQKSRGHNIYALKEKLKGIRDYRLDGFDVLLKIVGSSYYTCRYHGECARELDGVPHRAVIKIDQIDEFWLKMVESFPVPDEVKYHTAFIGSLFDTSGHPAWKHWATVKNKSLGSKLKIMEIRYIEVKHQCC